MRPEIIDLIVRIIKDLSGLAQTIGDRLEDPRPGPTDSDLVRLPGLEGAGNPFFEDFSLVFNLLQLVM